MQTLLPPIETAGHPYNSAALPRSLWWHFMKPPNKFLWKYFFISTDYTSNSDDDDDDDDEDNDDATCTCDAPAEPAAVPDWTDAPLSGNFDDSFSSASASEACNLVHFSSVCHNNNNNTTLQIMITTATFKFCLTSQFNFNKGKLLGNAGTRLFMSLQWFDAVVQVTQRASSL